MVAVTGAVLTLEAAASAYLSGEPKLVGGLKGADLMKIVIILVVLVGCALESAGIHWLTRAMVAQ